MRRALDRVQKLWGEGEHSVAVLQREMLNCIESAEEAVVDYIEFVDDGSLAVVDEIKSDVLVALAVKIGKTRLIDNAVLHT